MARHFGRFGPITRHLRIGYHGFRAVADRYFRFAQGLYNRSLRPVHRAEAFMSARIKKAKPLNGQPATREWQALNLQLVVFPKKSPLLVERDWWTEFTGQTPDASTKRLHERTAQGPFQGMILKLTLDVSRIVWMLHPRIEPSEGLETLPSLGAFRECRDVFVAAFTPWPKFFCRRASKGKFERWPPSRTSRNEGRRGRIARAAGTPNRTPADPYFKATSCVG
jgi:hypothetical protein